MRRLVIALLVTLAATARADLRLPDASRAGDLARCRKLLGARSESSSKQARRRLSLVDAADGVELRFDKNTVATCTIGVMRVPEGKLTLPAGWLAVDEQGIDSRVGKILDEHDAERLRYDIGAMAGVYANPREHADYAWFRDENVDGNDVHYGVQKGELRFTIDPFTNFWGPAPTPAQADALVAVLRTLRRRR